MTAAVLRPELRTEDHGQMHLDVDTLPSCCEATIAIAQDLGGMHRCPTCGELYEGEGGIERPSHVALVAHRALPLREVIADVVLALKWAREHQHDTLAPRPSALATLQGRRSVPADEDATWASTSALWRLITSPGSRIGRRARSSFTTALLRYCEDTSRDVVDVDWDRARSLASRLDSLPAVHRAVLVCVARRCRVDVAWDVAALAAADGCAPLAQHQRWTSTRRADRAAPPPELAALAWGDDALRAAVDAWSAARA